MTPPRRLDAVYELDVVGKLGPALRAIVESAASTPSSELQTIMCLRGHEGEDLVEILCLLRSWGLEVATINTIR